MDNYMPDYLQGADNVYRTPCYIVKQVMVIQKHKKENNVLTSHDTYYRRTPKRDLAYNLAFQGKRHINGKRLPSTNYTRTYVE